MTSTTRHPKLGMWLRKKRNFYIYSVATVGTAMWAILIWNFGRIGGALWIGFLGVVALLGSLMWGFLMWRLFAAPLVKRLGGSSDAT